MQTEAMVDFISKARTDFIFQLLKLSNWKGILNEGQVIILQWLVYCDDTTALKAVLKAGCNLNSITIDNALVNATFFGHWKVCDFLINHGANVNAHVDKINETPLHNALAKAGRPYYFYAAKLVVDKGTNVNAKTIVGLETAAFMRDVRTKGETPLHRAAAYADENAIAYLVEHGAGKTAKRCKWRLSFKWASEHFRPGSTLSLLAYGNYRISEKHTIEDTSDLGQRSGESMGWNLFGEYLPE